jgi:hypothetical protein
MADVRRACDLLGEPSDGKQAPAARQLVEEGQGCPNFLRGGTAIRLPRPGVGRNDVPAERIETELSERPPDDRRGRLSRPGARELPLRRERDPGDARAAPTGGLADQEQLSLCVPLEIRAQASSSELGAVALPVEVVRRADARGAEPVDKLLDVHDVTMLMAVKARIGIAAALFFGVCTAAAHAAPPPQGYQSDAAFAASYATHHVTSVEATAQQVSCYAPEVLYTAALTPAVGFTDPGATQCPGATTGEDVGPYAQQDVRNPPMRVKDHSESDLHVDPTNARHLIGISKWFVNAEGYNHLTGFYESFDGGATWPQQGHIPGYEGWTDNSDPAGAFDPWGNFYVVELAYMFDYTIAGTHDFLSPRVNPSLSRMVLGVAVRPHGATTATGWNSTRNGRTDFVATTPFVGLPTFDKQWIAIDTNRASKHFGRIYVTWAIGSSSDQGEGYRIKTAQSSPLEIYESYADARPDGTHTNWSTPMLAFRPRPGFGDNGSLPHVAPDGTVWLETSSFRGGGEGEFTPSLTSSRNGGVNWAARRIIARHFPSQYDNTTFRSAFGEAFGVGTHKVRGHYPLYLVYENGPNGPVRLYLTASFDGGKHWRRPILVNDNRSGAEALQPGLAVAPDGTVVVAFYDRRLPCPARGSAEATNAGIEFDLVVAFSRTNYCINTAVQLYRPGLKPIGHNIRMSSHAWDPQLNAARPVCICAPTSFIGDYFGVDARGGFAYTSSVTTYNEDGRNPLFDQQQDVARLKIP